MLLTLLAYDESNSCILEHDDETTCDDFPAIATGLRDRLPECSRVIILRDGKFAFDTNDVRH